MGNSQAVMGQCEAVKVEWKKELEPLKKSGCVKASNRVC
jgi:hypothetical protein